MQSEFQLYRRGRTWAAKRHGYNVAVSAKREFRTIGYASSSGAFWAARHDEAFIGGINAALIADHDKSDDTETRFAQVRVAAYFRRLQTASRLP